MELPKPDKGLLQKSIQLTSYIIANEKNECFSLRSGTGKMPALLTSM